MYRNLSNSMLCCRNSRIFLRNTRRTRLLSSVSQPTLTSFLPQHNERQLPNGKVASTTTKFSRTSISDLTHRAIPVPDPSIPLSAYKEIEKPTGMKLFKIYNRLAKSNLTILVVLMSMSGVALSPFPSTLPILLSTALGTVLCSASGNTLNQLQEVPFDAQMAWTRMRPLVRRAVTPLHGSGFALVTGVAGPALCVR